MLEPTGWQGPVVVGGWHGAGGVDGTEGVDGTGVPALGSSSIHILGEPRCPDGPREQDLA